MVAAWDHPAAAIDADQLYLNVDARWELPYDDARNAMVLAQAAQLAISLFEHGWQTRHHLPKQPLRPHRHGAGPHPPVCRDNDRFPYAGTTGGRPRSSLAPTAVPISQPPLLLGCPRAGVRPAVACARRVSWADRSARLRPGNICEGRPTQAEGGPVIAPKESTNEVISRANVIRSSSGQSAIARAKASRRNRCTRVSWSRARSVRATGVRRPSL
jgi:hypothetical protein